MSLQEFLPYSPILIVVIVFLLSYRIFVTPEQLEKKHRDIIQEIENKFVTKDVVNALKEDIQEVKKKVNDIYDFLLGNKK